MWKAYGPMGQVSGSECLKGLLMINEEGNYIDNKVADNDLMIIYS